MKAVILAAGKGARLCPLTCDLPKLLMHRAAAVRETVTEKTPIKRTPFGL